MTPGAISQHNRQLEDYAGTPLFKRTGRSVLLTDAAQAALPLVREAFDQIAAAGRIMQAPARKGRVMVSSAPSFAAKWLAPRHDGFHNGHPGVEAWVSADSGLTDFTTADADFAIRYGAGDYDGLKAEKLLDETVLPVCSPQLLEGSDAIRKPADLAKHTLIHDVSAEVDPSCPDWTSWLKARGAGADVDGTRGPRGSVQHGIVALAERSQTLIVQVAIIPSRRWILTGTWDRMQIPKPFARLDYAFGPPIDPKAQPASAATAEAIRQALIELDDRFVPAERARSSRAAQ